MDKIDFVTRELTALRIANRCTFIESQRERLWMANAVRAALSWAERHSTEIDPEAPYAIVDARPKRGRRNFH